MLGYVLVVVLYTATRFKLHYTPFSFTFAEFARVTVHSWTSVRNGSPTDMQLHPYAYADDTQMSSVYGRRASAAFVRLHRRRGTVDCV